MRTPLLTLTEAGLYCPPGDFFIDPWAPVAKAVITHAHGDHARRGSQEYLAAKPGVRVLQTRLGPEAIVQGQPYGTPLTIAGVCLTFHPAGHILGSAQVRLEKDGEIWVVTGDYKNVADQTCEPFESVRCHTLVTESTFGLPIYRWPSQAEVFQQINQWWRENRDAGRASLLFAYALGKAQRLLAGLDTEIGPIFGHGAVETLNHAYRESGIALPATNPVRLDERKSSWAGALILAPPSAQRSPWTRRFGDYSSAFVSGWMLIRGARRRRAVDRGFVLSDHADWPGLLEVIKASAAERVFVTHGQIAPMVRWLREQGLEAFGLQTRFEGEQDEGNPIEEPAA